MAIIEKYEWGERFKRGIDGEQLRLLKKGVAYWNDWIEERNVAINLYKADLSGMNLKGVDFSGADLGGAKLDKANLSYAHLYDAELDEASLCGANLSDSKVKGADFSGADLSGANFFRAKVHRASFRRANLSGAKLIRAKMTNAGFEDANLTGADLSDSFLRQADLRNADLTKAKLVGTRLTEANLNWANLTNANLTNADLQKALMVETIVENAVFSNCRIYGLSVWAIKGTPKKQSNLIITSDDEAMVTADELDVAQFIYLLINREKLRNVITTITSKAVLLLGRFTPDRKPVLDALADELRKYDLLPIIFDFERAKLRDFTETIMLLAGMSNFVIVDITNPQSAPLELQATVPDYQIPFIPIIKSGEHPFSMFKNLTAKYYWIFEPIEYDSVEILLRGFQQIFIDRAAKMRRKIDAEKSKPKSKAERAEDFLARNKRKR